MNDWLKYNVSKIFLRLGLEIHRKRRKCCSAVGFDYTFMRLAKLRDLGFISTNICDIGASNGSWTRNCLEIFPDARYFCVDPLDENQQDLAQLSYEHSNVSYWQGCLGPKIGIVTLNVDGAGSSILRGHFGNPYGIQREIRCETLDNLILQGICPQPDLIKLDVQGYELDVLKGAPGALKTTQAIIAEVSFFSFQNGMPVLHEVVEQLAEYGFVVYDILSMGMRPLDGAAGQTDLLFLQATHLLRSSNKWDGNSVY